MEEYQTIGITELRAAFGDTFNRCHYGRIPIIITKHGSAHVMLVPVTGTLDEHTDLRELVAETLGLEYPRAEEASEEGEAGG
jgi:prevent-host-death family protein